MTSEQQNSYLHGQNSLVPQTDIPVPIDSQAIGTLSLRLQHLETLCKDLQKEKNVMEDQFGQQRKKFMNLMVQKDAELSAVKKSVERYSSEAQKLSQQLKLREMEVRMSANEISVITVVHRYKTWLLLIKPWTHLPEKHLMLIGLNMKKKLHLFIKL